MSFQRLSDDFFCLGRSGVEAAYLRSDDAEIVEAFISELARLGLVHASDEIQVFREFGQPSAESGCYVLCHDENSVLAGIVRRHRLKSHKQKKQALSGDQPENSYQKAKLFDPQSVFVGAAKPRTRSTMHK